MFIREARCAIACAKHGPSLSKGKSLGGEKGQGFDLVCLLLLLLAVLGPQSLTYSYILPARGTGVGGGWVVRGHGGEGDDGLALVGCCEISNV